MTTEKMSNQVRTTLNSIKGRWLVNLGMGGGVPPEALTDFLRTWYIIESAKKSTPHQDLCAEVKEFLDKEHWSEIDSHHPEYLLGGDVDFNQEEDDE